MKMNNIHMKFALGLALMTGFAHAQTWQGGTGNWTDDNWGMAGEYPGSTDNDSAVEIQNGGVVTLNSDLPFSVGDGFTNQFTMHTATLNISADITSNAYASMGNWDSSTINHTSGTFQQGPRWDLGSAGGNGGSSLVTTYALSGDAIGLINSTDFRFGYTSGGANRAFLTATDTAQLTLNNSTQWNQGTISLSGNADFTIANAATMAGTSVFEMSENATADFGTFNATAGLVRMTVGSTGINSLTAGTLGLGSEFELDLTNWDGSSGLVGGTHMILADYGALTGTFSSVNVTGGSGSLVYDYDMGGGDLAVAYVIPEPGTMALFAIAGLSMVIGLRRRSKSTHQLR